MTGGAMCMIMVIADLKVGAGRTEAAGSIMTVTIEGEGGKTP
jgi:hypothetical protein